MSSQVKEYNYRQIEDAVKNLKSLSKQLKIPFQQFDEEEQELIYRVFKSIYPDKIKSPRDKQLAKQILEKLFG